jgi:hypothetical protein
LEANNNEPPVRKAAPLPAASVEAVGVVGVTGSPLGGGR